MHHTVDRMIVSMWAWKTQTSHLIDQKFIYKQIQTQVYHPPPVHNNYISIAFDRQKLTAGVLLTPPVEIAIESVSERNRQPVMSVVKTLINYYHSIYLTMQLCCSKLPLQPAIKKHKSIIFCTVLNNVQLIDSFFQNFLIYCTVCNGLSIFFAEPKLIY